MNFFIRAYRFFFDFSAGEREVRKLTGILRVTLAETDSDDGFEACFRRIIGASSGLSEERAWSRLNRRLLEYRRPGEFERMPRTLAQRYLDDLPRRYGVKKTQRNS